MINKKTEHLIERCQQRGIPYEILEIVEAWGELRMDRRARVCLSKKMCQYVLAEIDRLLAKC